MKAMVKNTLIMAMIMDYLFCFACFAVNGEAKLNKIVPTSPAISAVQHSLLTDDPSKVCLDLWGWEACPSYQRTFRRNDFKVVSPEYICKRTVDESYKWGANIVEGHRFPYPRVMEQQAGWNKESTAALHRHYSNCQIVSA
ncbi:MAG: hypothetical protein PHV34_13405 [Verrucomicrobiae bacterium]|nr:hypothetical protein [Verrucomicrobiae bacterium]